MRSVLSLGFLISLATFSRARAEDFTGAYAGVNAGYGFERRSDAKRPNTPAVSGPDATPSNDLPPSAAVAARSMRPARPAAPR